MEYNYTIKKTKFKEKKKRKNPDSWVKLQWLIFYNKSSTHKDIFFIVNDNMKKNSTKYIIMCVKIIMWHKLNCIQY